MEGKGALFKNRLGSPTGFWNNIPRENPSTLSNAFVYDDYRVC